MKALSALATLGLGLMLSACQVVGPDYQAPADAAVQRKDAPGELAAGNRDVVSAPVPSDWWRLYQDPRLDQLVQHALASNTDLRVAAANLLEARAALREKDTQRQPSTAAAKSADQPSRTRSQSPGCARVSRYTFHSNSTIWVSMPRSAHHPRASSKSAVPVRPSAAATSAVFAAATEALKASTCGKIRALARPCGRCSNVPSIIIRPTRCTVCTLTRSTNNT